jgi:hypothetical protein
MLLLAITAMTSGCWSWGPRDGGGYYGHDHYDHHDDRHWDH